MLTTEIKLWWEVVQFFYLKNLGKNFPFFFLNLFLASEPFIIKRQVNATPTPAAPVNGTDADNATDTAIPGDDDSNTTDQTLTPNPTTDDHDHMHLSNSSTNDTAPPSNDTLVSEPNAFSSGILIMEFSFLLNCY